MRNESKSGSHSGLIAQNQNASNIVLRLTETLGGNAHVLLIRKRHALAGGFKKLLGDGFIANGECEDLRGNTGLSRHGDLAFPCFANPAFMGNFLELARAFAARITVVQRDPNPGGEAERGYDNEPEEGVDNPTHSRLHSFLIVTQNVLVL